jgi:hypothetical protein
MLFLTALFILACCAHDTIDLRPDLLALEPLPLARQLARLQFYLTRQRDVPGADSGKLQLMLQLIELHRASSRREPLQRLAQLVRSHAKQMRGLVRRMLVADTGPESELSESAAEQALFQVEQDWELHSYATDAEKTRFRRLLRRFRALQAWDAEKRGRLGALLAHVRQMEDARRLMRLFEARATELTEAQIGSAVARIRALGGPTWRLGQSLQELRTLWIEERGDITVQ